MVDSKVKKRKKCHQNTKTQIFTKGYLSAEYIFVGFSAFVAEIRLLRQPYVIFLAELNGFKNLLGPKYSFHH